ncbi:hypothetical protein JNJ66_07355 [Candidatus Saccharibacteria bacterium]|nr:hypothetical protein [Candidatus Saccharibacteria bacterium]
MPTMAPTAIDQDHLTQGARRLLVERLGMLVPDSEAPTLTYVERWRQCFVAGGECAHHYSGSRGGTRRDCDMMITLYNLRADFGPLTEVRGWAYAYTVPQQYPGDQGFWSEPYAEYDIWSHFRRDAQVLRVARRIQNGKITMARRDTFNWTVPTILGFTGHPKRYTAVHHSDPWR